MTLRWRAWSLFGLCSFACARTVSNTDEAVAGGAGFADAGEGSTSSGGDGGSAPRTGGLASTTTTGGRSTTGGAGTGGAGASGGETDGGETSGGAGAVEPPACYSPDQNLEGAYDPDAMGCPCNEANE